MQWVWSEELTRTMMLSFSIHHDRGTVHYLATENLYEWQLFATFSFVDTDYNSELFSTLLRN